MESTRRRPIFAVTALGAFVTSLDLSSVNVAFPAIQRSFPEAGRAGSAWVITAYAIVFGALLITGGRLADRYGRRRVFLAGLALFAAGGVVCAVSPAIPPLVVGRVVQATGAACVMPAALGLLLAAYADRRAQAVTLWAGIGALAVATGPSLGALLVHAWGWRAIFVLGLGVALAAAAVGAAVLPRLPGTGGGRIDIAGVILLVAGLAALVLAITRGTGWGWTDPRVIASFLLAAALLGGFLLRSARHREPVLDLTLFRERTFTLANIATVVFGAGFFAMLLGNVLFLTTVWGWPVLQAGLAVTPGPMVVALLSGLAGRAMTRYGPRPVLLLGTVLYCAAMAWYVFRLGTEPTLAGWLPANIVGGAGVALTMPVLTASSAARLPADRLAVGGAVNQTGRQIGGAIGVALLVPLLGTASGAAALAGFHRLWAFAAACSVLAGLTAIALGRHTPRPESVRAPAAATTR